VLPCPPTAATPFSAGLFARAPNGRGNSAMDWRIPNQANVRMSNAGGARAKSPAGKVVVTVGEHGNTSAASVPLALDQAVRDGRVKPGHCVLLEGFGGGFAWGSALIKM